jgi:hypothetical protein
MCTDRNKEDDRHTRENQAPINHHRSVTAIAVPTIPRWMTESDAFIAIYSSSEFALL